MALSVVSFFAVAYEDLVSVLTGPSGERMLCLLNDSVSLVITNFGFIPFWVLWGGSLYLFCLAACL